jgi:biofilm protein TabA
LILSGLENAGRFEKLHPGFAAGFAFLRRSDLNQLAEGRHEIDGPRLYAEVQRGQGQDEVERDVQFFLDKPDSWITIPPGRFGIIFPEDAHAPQAADGVIHKVVIKVAVDWGE